MVIDIAKTLIGKSVDGWWIFSGIMAERVSELTGLKLVKSFNGIAKAGFAEKDECLYTAKLVKAGYKICITQ